MSEDAVHAARKPYLCVECSRRMTVGEAYTLRSFKPYETAAKLSTWTSIRICSTCLPIADDHPMKPKATCDFGNGTVSCTLPANHPDPEHQLPIGLF